MSARIYLKPSPCAPLCNDRLWSASPADKFKILVEVVILFPGSTATEPETVGELKAVVPLGNDKIGLDNADKSN